MPQDFSVGFGAEVEQQAQAFSQLQVLLILGVLLVYAVMASQYESLRDPFIVMFSVPVAAIGVVAALKLTATTFSLQAYIGVIMLAGIVVSNAILLVDYTNVLRRRDGMPLREAVEQAGRTRLRPILMTTLTTVLGLVPMALGLGEGGELQAPLGARRHRRADGLDARDARAGARASTRCSKKAGSGRARGRRSRIRNGSRDTMKKLLIALILILLAGAGYYAYVKYGASEDKATVTQAALQQGNIVQAVQATGTLEALRNVQVGSQVSGIVKTLYADFNSIVKKDQVIAELDPSLLQVQVEVQQANIERQQGDIAQQKVQLENDQVNLDADAGAVREGARQPAAARAGPAPGEDRDRRRSTRPRSSSCSRRRSSIRPS